MADPLAPSREKLRPKRAMRQKSQPHNYQAPAPTVFETPPTEGPTPPERGRGHKTNRRGCGRDRLPSSSTSLGLGSPDAPLAAPVGLCGAEGAFGRVLAGSDRCGRSCSSSMDANSCFDQLRFVFSAHRRCIKRIVCSNDDCKCDTDGAPQHGSGHDTGRSRAATSSTMHMTGNGARTGTLRDTGTGDGNGKCNKYYRQASSSGSQ